MTDGQTNGQRDGHTDIYPYICSWPVGFPLFLQFVFTGLCVRIQLYIYIYSIIHPMNLFNSRLETHDNKLHSVPWQSSDNFFIFHYTENEKVALLLKTTAVVLSTLNVLTFSPVSHLAQQHDGNCRPSLVISV